MKVFHTVFFIICIFLIWPLQVYFLLIPAHSAVHYLQGFILFFSILNLLDYCSRLLQGKSNGEGVCKRGELYGNNSIYTAIMDFYTVGVRYPKVSENRFLPNFIQSFSIGLLMFLWMYFYDDGQVRGFWIAVSFIMVDGFVYSAALLIKRIVDFSINHKR
ncbi:hypothetical protein [Vogesella indigofera]|uniref:hypothetical protein n=1 Tax=Vogesella indigofera TaxID=45465 RepID=UPI0035B38FDD